MKTRSFNLILMHTREREREYLMVTMASISWDLVGGVVYPGSNFCIVTNTDCVFHPIRKKRRNNLLLVINFKTPWNGNKQTNKQGRLRITQLIRKREEIN